MAVWNFSVAGKIFWGGLLPVFQLFGVKIIFFSSFELVWEKLSHKNAIKIAGGHFFGRKIVVAGLAVFGGKKGGF